MQYRVPLHLEPQPEGGYTVTSPVLPELITEGDTVEECIAHARECFELVRDYYQDKGRELPAELLSPAEPTAVSLPRLDLNVTFAT